MMTRHTGVRFALLVALCILIGMSSLRAETKIRILGLTVEGNEMTDAGLIRAHSGLIIGKDISGDDVQTAIRQLWKLNLFSDIQIVEDKEVSGGVYVVIKVKEYPRLERLDVKGNKKLKGQDLESLLLLTKGQVLQPRDITRLQNRLMKKYEEMGYLLAEINTKTFISDETKREIVEVNIKEGKKVRIKKILFEGNSAFSDSKLRGKLKNSKQKSLFRSGEFKKENLETDGQLVSDFYRSQGYRNFEIIDDSVTYSEDKRWVYITYYVNEGRIFHYGDFSWSGNKLFTAEQLGARIKVAKGDYYNSTKFDLSLADVGAMYYDKGYIYASVTPTEKVVNDSIIDINLVVVEGSEFKVSKISIDGNTKTKEKVIRRELVLFPGETFDVSKLRRSIREVTILNYFGNITPDVVPINDNQVDLNLKVEEKSTDQANASAGYSQRDGFIGSLGFQMNNLLGNGQQFGLDWSFGSVYRSFSISFTEPWFRNSRTLVGASFFDTHRGGTYYGFDESIIGGTLRVGRRLKWPDDYFRLDYVYRLDRTEYSNFTDEFRASNPRNLHENDPRISSSITQSITRDSRNDPEFPSIGSVNVLRTEVTGGIFGGNDQFIKAEFNNQWYVPIVGNLVMMADNEIGALDGLTRNMDDIPYFDYFFMGGAGLSLGTSLRGYDEREVGPQSGSYPVGGKTLFKQSSEFRYPVLRNPTIYALTFAEAGNVWRSFESTNPTELKRSVGLGVRLYMPFIGMIGLDYGLGLDYRDDRGLRTTKWVPHFQFGRSF
jgi:outer membrane protein insertion porin family